MVKGTGKFIYDPESKGRHWIPKVSEGTRYQEYKEHPFLTGLEDVTNVAIVGAPIFKALGIGGKVAKLAPVKATTKWAKGTAVGENLSRFQGRLATKGKFSEIMGKSKQDWFSAKEGILYNNKFMRAFTNVPESTASHLFKVAEGTANWTDDVARLSYNQAVKAGYTAPYATFKTSADSALKLIRKNSIKESNWLVKEGILTEEQALKASWTPAVKKHLVKTGRYTAQELDDLLIKNKGFAKTLDDEFIIAVKELKDIGIESPVYMPHMWEKYLSKADFYSKQPMAKYTPGFLKKRTGMSGYLDEPITVLTRHELQKVKWRQSNDLVNQLVNKYGKTIGEEGILTGYKAYYPEGFLKNVLNKNKLGTKIQLPDFMVGELNKVFNAPTGFEQFLRATYDPATNVWRTSVLALSPRWVFNNFMGNTLLNLAGAVNPFAYIKAGQLMKKARVLAKEKGWTVNKAMKKLGIPEEVSRGLYQAEARGSAAGLAQVAKTAPVQNRLGKALNYTGLPQMAKGMYRFNSGIESFYRTAHYLDKIGKPGFNSKLAIKSVNEFLFDYTGLSAMEKATIRRILPFWSWQKNITRLVATYPFKYPQRMAVLQKVQKLVEEPEGMNFDFLPEYMKSYVPTPFKSTNEETMYLSTRGLNPFSDVGVGLSNINPMLKIGLEQITGTNLFKNRPFSSPDRPYGSDEKITPNIFRHIASQFPQYQLFQNLTKPYAKYDTGEPILDTKTGQPKYSKNRLLDLLKMFGISMTPYDIESMTQQEIEKLIKKQTTMSNYAEKLRKFQQQ